MAEVSIKKKLNRLKNFRPQLKRIKNITKKYRKP